MDRQSRISRSLSSGRPTGSGLWPARWQAPAGPGGSFRATTLLVIAVVLILPVVVVIALAEAGLPAIRADFEQARVGRAGPVGGAVHVAGATILRLFGKRAQRHRAVDAECWIIVDEMRGRDRVRRHATLDPLLKHAQRVEQVRSRPAAAMVHAGRQEQPHVLAQLVEARRAPRQRLVMADGAERRQRRVAETVIDDELADLPEEP